MPNHIHTHTPAHTLPEGGVDTKKVIEHGTTYTHTHTYVTTHTWLKSSRTSCRALSHVVLAAAAIVVVAVVAVGLLYYL